MSGEGPIQLARMVNKTGPSYVGSEAISFTIQASWMGSNLCPVSRLAHRLLHHPHEADGVENHSGLPRGQCPPYETKFKRITRY